MNIAAVPLHRIAGRVTYAAQLIPLSGGARIVCEHHRGHRTVAAAMRCGNRIKRIYESLTPPQ